MIIHKVLLIVLIVSLTVAKKEENAKLIDATANRPSAEQLSPPITSNFVRGNNTESDSSSTEDDTDSSALAQCRKYCSCSTDNKIIECDDMHKLWALITKGAEYDEEFAGFHLKVSDKEIEEIGRDFTLDVKSTNGLIGIKHLVLDDFPSLTNINPSFFEKTFPNLEHLTITQGDNKLREVTVGYLPHLVDLRIKGDTIAKVTGCHDDETYCFHPDIMELLELPTLTLMHMGLPDDINSVTIIPNDADSPEDGDDHIFDNKVVEYLKFIMKTDTNFPVLFEKITVNEEFYFELPQMDNEQMELVVADIHKNPSLYSRMRIQVNKSDFLFPVYYKSCTECDYDDIYNSLQKSGTCAEEKKYLEKYNPDLDDLKNRDIIIRGIYIDIDDVIKKVMSYKPKPKNTLTVYTFVAKKPKFKTIDFHIKIYYAVLDGHSSLQQHISLSSPETSTTFSIQEMFGTSLKFAKRLDALFVQSYSTCIAKLATDFKKNSPTRYLKDSPPWEMFINLPNTGIYTTRKDSLINSKASTIQSLLTKYMYMLAEEKNTLNKIPYATLDVQRELAHVLLKSAENILQKKQNFSSRRKIEDVEDATAEKLKTMLDAENEAEVKLLVKEQDKTKSLVNIVTKQKELYEGELQAIQDALRDVKGSYSVTQEEFETKSELFANGAITRHAQTWADVSSELTRSIITVINAGRFDMSEMADSPTVTGKILRKINSLKRILQKIIESQKKMKKIGKIFRKIEKVYNSKYNTLKTDLRKIKYDEVNPKEMSKFSDLVNRFTENVQTADDIAEGVLAVYKARMIADHGDDAGYSKEDILFTEEINIMNPGEEISAKDIIQWEDVRSKIESLFGRHIMLEIPETGEYKAAMFNMVTKGKAITQLKLDESKLMADIGFSDKSYWEYVEEYASLGMSIMETVAARKARRIDYGDEKAEKEYEAHYNKVEKNLYSEEFISKLMIIEARHEFCQGYYYYHLKRCPGKYDIDIYTSLTDTIEIYRNLVLEQTIRELHIFQPPPQYFNNIAVFIRKEENCHCVQEPYAKLKAISGRTTSLKEQRIFRDASIKNCFPGTTKPYTEEDKMNIFDKLDSCNMNRLKRFSKENTISFDIPINFMKSFDHYERVRIEEAKVYLDGVKTTNGKVVMKIENSGILEDRYKGEVFKFLGAPWIRNYEYCSKNIKKDKHEVSDDVPTWCLSRRFKTLVSTITYKTFEGFYPKPTLFSTWVISVPKEDNPGLDLSKLKSIQINFSGSLIFGRTNYSSYDMYGNPPISDTDN